MANVDTNNELERWLNDVAGLQGKKLTACLAACDEAFIENVEDLRMQHNSEGLKALFPAGITNLVAKALGAHKPSEKQTAAVATSPSSTVKQNTGNDNKKRPSVVRRNSVMGAGMDLGKEKPSREVGALPADKDYFAFLSHKKNNSKLGTITEMLALRVVSGLFSIYLSCLLTPL